MTEYKPLVALVGRPNVGKSSLFNRLVGSRQAITDSQAGTTRDRIYGDGEWQGNELTFIDTGGLIDETATDSLTKSVNGQVRQAIAEADLVLFLVDAQAGVTAADRTVLDLVRRTAGRVLLIVNKADNVVLESGAAEFYELGVSAVHIISTLHGRGTGDLLDAIVAETREVAPRETSPSDRPRTALVGRANVGKSTLLNQFAAAERMITSSEPHTTRDAASYQIETAAGPLELIDTAGIRRRGQSGRGMTKYSLLRTIRAINDAEVVCLLLDGVEGATTQDAHIASYIQEAGKAIVLVVNKWDLVEKAPDVQEQFYHQLQEKLGFLPSPPVVFLSAKTGAKLAQLPRAIYDVWHTAGRTLETSELNTVLRAALPRLPAGSGRHAPKFYYATQVDTHPPTFLLFVNKAEAWGTNHRRYLMNVLRDHYQLLGTPVNLRFRSKPPREAVAS